MAIVYAGCRISCAQLRMTEHRTNIHDFLMLNSKVMLKKELETAVLLARDAGKAMMAFYETDLKVNEKFADDSFAEPVTEADFASNKVIIEGLKAAFPGDGILSEETPDTPDRLAKKRVWIIDPLDGTKGFINRDGDFAVQIGLAIDGAPALGVVYLPFEDVLYTAVKNQSAWISIKGGVAKKLQVSEKTDFSQMNMAVSRDHRSPKMGRIFEHLGLKSETRRGSVGLKTGLIAQQICDLYLHLSPRTKFWDTCAPQIILEEAGGKMTDLFGCPIVYDLIEFRNLNGIAATNGSAHGIVIDTLRPLLAEFGRVRIQ
jgi:3'(2'), 5'-bisphosphate nucleotidase